MLVPEGDLPDPLLRAALFATAHLDAPLLVEDLATVAGCSVAHFHRTFRAHTGETPAQFVSRMRLLRAASHLRTHASRVLDVAIGCGFTNPDTFARAFRRRYGCTPQQWRRRDTLTSGLRDVDRSVTDGSFSVGKARRVELGELTVVRKRLRGAYEAAWPHHWRDVVDAVESAGGVAGDLLGVGYDDPSVTAQEDLRFDVMVRVDDRLDLPSPLEWAQIGGGTHALVSFCGPFGVLGHAYPQIYASAAGLRGVRIIGLPVIECYGQALLGETLMQQVDVYVPIEPLTAPSDRAG